jgi:hypothetical protein
VYVENHGGMILKELGEKPVPPPFFNHKSHMK